jgi:hypothetical protein
MVTRAPCGSTFSILRSPLVRLLLLGAAALAFVPTVPSMLKTSTPTKSVLAGSGLHSTPSGSLQGSSDSGTINLQQDLGFNSYSTFVGKID